MNVLLIDVDSKIPNLALMQISAWHKQKEDNVSFKEANPEIVYISCIYKKNASQAIGISKMFPDAKVFLGGSGINYDWLPLEMQKIKSDYDLYSSKYSMGFTTRGCIRYCNFCIVPQKEGKFQRWQHPQEFYDERFDTIMLLDNNWLVDEEWFMKTSEWIIDQSLILWEHGLDIRLLNDKKAKRLSELKMKKGYHFAFDNMGDKEAVMRGIEILKEYGFNLRQEVQFYVYVDSDDEFESGLERCRILKEQNTNPFVMFNCDKKRTRRIKDLQRWANRKWLFWSCEFEDYMTSHNGYYVMRNKV